jgi:nucleoside-diphosphate-sugar epimerase
MPTLRCRTPRQPPPRQIAGWPATLTVSEWGSGQAAPLTNVGSGEDVTILELTQLVCGIVGFKGKIVHDLSKPDGTPRKLMSADKIWGLNWAPSIAIEEGVARTYRWFQENVARR